MICSACDFENAKNANFCCKCGAAISGPLAIESVRASVQQQIDDFMANRLRELKLVEREVLARIQEGGVKRLKLFGGILAMIIGAGTYIGINEFEGIKKISQDIEMVRTKTEKIRDQTLKASDAAKSASDSIDKVLEDVENAVTRANQAEKQVTLLLVDLESGRVELANAIKDADEKLNLSINAKYKISVHVPSGGSEVESFLLRLRETLGSKGFHVKAEDTLWLAVDRTEILYYYIGDKERAEDIQQVLKKQNVLETTIRKEDIPSRNYEIQIKVAKVPMAGPV